MFADRKFGSLVVGFSAVVLFAVALVQAQTKVYLLAGQSNMVGWANNSALPTELQQFRPDIQTYWQGTWHDLQPGLGGNGSKFGPEVTLGRDLADAQPDENIVLIKYAVSGTNLWNEWRPTDGTQYLNFMDAVDDALLSISDPNIAGMIWMQGESDAYPPHSTLSYAEAYEQNLVGFIESVRSDLGIPDMPFVIGQISDEPVWTWGDIVRQAQLNVSRSVPNTTLVITSELGIQVDGMHYNPAGIMTLGRRFACAMRDLELSVSEASSDDGDTTLSWEHAVGDGNDRILVVGIAGEDDSADDLVISSIRYNNVDMNLVAGSSRLVCSPTVCAKTELYYLLDDNLPLSGSYMVDVTYSGNVDKSCAGVITLKNVEQQPAEVVDTNSSEDANSVRIDLITQTCGAWVVDIVSCGEQGWFTADEGQVERFGTGGSSTGAGSTRWVASAGSTTLCWSHTGSSQLAHSAAAFAPAKRTISGYVLEPNDAPIEGVMVSPDNGGSSGLTDANGCYEISVPYNWSGTVTPTKAECRFNPPEAMYIHVVVDKQGCDYEGEKINVFDLDQNGIIDWRDMDIMSQNWLESGPDVEGDLNDDGIVNSADFAEFARIW